MPLPKLKAIARESMLRKLEQGIGCETGMKAIGDSAELIIRLYRDNWKLLFQSAFRVLKDKQACEDIIQDVFIAVWNKRSELENIKSCEAYLISSVRYEVFRRARQDKKFEPIVNEMADLYFEASTMARLEYKELIQEISDRVKDLPEKCREVYIMSREEHLSHKEISVRLSISTNTVRNHLTRALRQLRLECVELVVFIAFYLWR